MWRHRSKSLRASTLRLLNLLRLYVSTSTVVSPVPVPSRAGAVQYFTVFQRSKVRAMKWHVRIRY